MKTLARGLLLSLGVLFISGCTTSQTARIRQSPELFGSLTPNQQRLIQAGKVKVGFTADMVYLAMGNPDKVLKFKAPNSELDAWVYRRMTTHIERVFGGAITQVDAYAYVRRSLLLPSDSLIFDGNGMIQAGPYDQAPIELNQIQTLSLIFRAGKVVAIKVVG